MDNESVDIRKDTATKITKASAEDIYNSFLDADAVAKWRPPVGMRCHIYSFHPREGGVYHMAFEYGGTEVTFTASHVPAIIKPEDHYRGMISTLDNLAVYTE
jgi:hypothetical protein